MTSANPPLRNRAALSPLPSPTAQAVRRGLLVIAVAALQLVLIVLVVATTLGVAAGSGGIGPDRPPAPEVHPEPGF